MSLERDMMMDDIESDVTEILGGMIEDESGCMVDPYDGYEKSCGDLELDFINKECFDKVMKEINNPKSKYRWLKRRLITWDEKYNTMRFDVTRGL